MKTVIAKRAELNRKRAALASRRDQVNERLATLKEDLQNKMDAGKLDECRKLVVDLVLLDGEEVVEIDAENIELMDGPELKAVLAASEATVQDSLRIEAEEKAKLVVLGYEDVPYEYLHEYPHGITPVFMLRNPRYRAAQAAIQNARAAVDFHRESIKRAVAKREEDIQKIEARKNKLLNF